MFKMTIILSRIACLVFLVAAFSPSAFAIQDVSTPGIEAGVGSFEVRGGWQNAAGPTRWRLREHVDYAFTDSFALRLAGQQQRTRAEGWRYASTEVEGRFQFVEKKEAGWAAGMRLSYSVADDAAGGADVIRTRFLGQWGVGGMDYALNADFGREVGSRRAHGIQFGTRAQAAYRWRPDVSAGAEIFSAYGTLDDISSWEAQRHQFGPVAKVKFSDSFDMQFGYLVGLTAVSPDGEGKVFARWSF